MIQELYKKNCETPSDINQLLPVLKSYYDRCETVTEFGVRSCVSLSAALASSAKKVVAYDIYDVAIPECEKLTFICADDLKVDIEETDILFIDTYHTYGQLKAELERHHSKVKKYIAMHDTEFYGINGEQGARGLKYAITEFLATHPEWQTEFVTEINNGLTILKRV